MVGVFYFNDMDEIKVRKLGVEKTKVFNEKFDELYEKYKKKSLESGLSGELKFEKQHGRIFIYAVI